MTFTQHVPPWPGLEPPYTVEGESLEQILAHPRLADWPGNRARGEVFDGWFYTGPVDRPNLIASYDRGLRAYMLGVLSTLPPGLPRWPGLVLSWDAPGMLATGTGLASSNDARARERYPAPL
jgi:hypothetical protein